MVKKLVAAAAVSTAALLMSGCGSSSDTTTAETSSSATTTATEAELTTPTVAPDASTQQSASDGTNSTDSGAASTAAGEFNDADVLFARSMIPHHVQAVEMAKLAPERSQNPEILDLAQRIQGAQDPEIELMRSWLAAWGQPELPADMAGMDHGDMEGMEGMDHSMAGMMTGEDMTALENASGPEFDQMFADMMIEHHEGAIAMAQGELNTGASPEAKQLAEEIITAQTAEIAEMQNFALG